MGLGVYEGGPVLPQPGFPQLWLCTGGPRVAPRGRAESRLSPPLSPHPAPQAEKVSQICRNRSGGGGSDTVTALMSPLRVPQVLPSPRGHGPTTALPLTRARRGGDNAKIFPSPPPSCPRGPWKRRSSERPRARHTELQPLPSSPGTGGWGVSPGLRGLCQGVRGEPGRFLNSRADSCRASCGFPLRSPPGAVTPSTHTPAPRVIPPRRHPPGAGGESLGQSELLGTPAPTLYPAFIIHPTPTLHQSLHPLCTPNTPRAPLNTPNTPVTLLSALPTPPAPPVLPQCPGGGDTGPPTVGHSQPTAAPGGRRMQLLGVTG